MGRGVFLVSFGVLFLIFISGLSSAALGITPAVRKYDFVPGKVIDINFDVISDNPNQLIELYVVGDLAEFVVLSKDRTVGPGRFKATISFPSELDRPGDHFLGIGAKEVPPENSFLGSAIDVRATIKIFAPFPGKYIEAVLNIPDGNVNEEIPIELYLVNRGQDNLDVTAYIDFFDGNNEVVERMSFESVILNTTGERYFRKFLDTTSYKPGDYVAEAVVNYGDETRVEKTFRIGSLFVNITNFTEELRQQEGFQEFLIGIESKWNDDLEEVFADVNITNGVETISFRTPSTDLKSWMHGELTGFIDTSEMEGGYDVGIVLRYDGQETIVDGSLRVIRVVINYALISIIAGIIVLALLVLIIWLVRKRRKKH
jgi:hypothetical protein